MMSKTETTAEGACEKSAREGGEAPVRIVIRITPAWPIGVAASTVVAGAIVVSLEANRVSKQIIS
jgi:hypothetical protein